MDRQVRDDGKKRINPAINGQVPEQGEAGWKVTEKVEADQAEADRYRERRSGTDRHGNGRGRPGRGGQIPKKAKWNG